MESSQGDTPATSEAPAPIAEIRDRLHAQLDRWTTPGAESPASAREADHLASAIRALDEVDAAQRHRAPAPPFDVKKLGEDVWNAVAEAGGPTAASDAAVETIRKAVADV